MELTWHHRYFGRVCAKVAVFWLGVGYVGVALGWGHHKRLCVWVVWGFGFQICDFGRDLLEFSPIRPLQKIVTFDREGQFDLCAQIVTFGGPAGKVWEVAKLSKNLAGLVTGAHSYITLLYGNDQCCKQNRNIFLHKTPIELLLIPPYSCHKRRIKILSKTDSKWGNTGQNRK